MLLFLTALNATDAVTEGFLPAAARLGLPVVILTDQPDPHIAAYSDHAYPPEAVVACAVRDGREVIDAVHRAGPATGLLTNSDHLQVPTAQAAHFLGLPGKDWRAALRCKDKALTRRALADCGLDRTAAAVLAPGEGPPAAMVYPAVVKPRQGVASEDVYLVVDADELATRIEEIRRRRPDVALVVEEYLSGELYTFDTLGDAADLAVVGSWQTTLASPPTFVEQRLDWSPALDPAVRESLLAQLRALGVGLGACHTEFVLCDGRPRIIEVNYRLIGDRMDLVLARLLDVPLFEHVIRLHLGEPLDALALPDPVAVPRHAAVEYVCADRAGTLREAPGRVDLTVGEVRLSARPLRTVGTSAPLRGTNRDYLAAVEAIGPDRCAVDAAIAEFRATRRWVIA
ncbi:ATP-grasp domain-containing protein [Micromonospora sp. A200]|uniref:ATP-grasp domain-containing protein n=1 Tax=Micromonospora sp. A200 TaxID=2940568 RepID=UPI002474F8C9|nr:ATP-grasp domain-containing protein [Micromonospora sp. A200]